MITAVLLGLLMIVLLAGVVGVIDMLQASSWREVAAERRRRGEIRRARRATVRSRPA